MSNSSPVLDHSSRPRDEMRVPWWRAPVPASRAMVHERRASVTTSLRSPSSRSSPRCSPSPARRRAARLAADRRARALDELDAGDQVSTASLPTCSWSSSRQRRLRRPDLDLADRRAVARPAPASTSASNSRIIELQGSGGVGPASWSPCFRREVSRMGAAKSRTS